MRGGEEVTPTGLGEGRKGETRRRETPQLGRSTVSYRADAVCVDMEDDAGYPSILNPRPSLPTPGQSEKCYGCISVQLAPSPPLLFQQLGLEPLLCGGHFA